MSTSKRQEQILEIIRNRNYISVNELAKLTYTSPSSIRRDLTSMQNQGLVARSHGGVTLPDSIRGVASFHDRMTKNAAEKRIIAKKAASLLKNGQTVLLDSSSTAGFLVPYLALFESVTVFTNNLVTAMSLIEAGVNTHCIGGSSVGGSAAMSGSEAFRTVSSIRPDILFFSSQSLDSDGIISDSTEEENYMRSLMIDSAKKTVFLCDSNKFCARSIYTLTSIDKIDVSVFDKDFESLIVNSSLTL